MQKSTPTCVFCREVNGIVEMRLKRLGTQGDFTYAEIQRKVMRDLR